MSAPAAFNLKLPVRHPFPIEHIEAFGSGRVDKVYLSFATNGAITKAEANLIEAPYKRMIIDDPAILRIFGDRGDKIDMSALHPAAKFRLDPLELIDNENGELDLASFDFGRLFCITHLPGSARFGWSKNHLGKADPTAEGEVQKRVREALLASEQKQTAKKRVDNARSSRAPLTATPSKLVLRSGVKARKELEPTESDDVPPSQPSFKNEGISEHKRTRAAKSPRYLAPSPPASVAPEGSDLGSHMPSLPVRPSGRKPRRTTPIPNGPEGQRMSIVYQQIMQELSEDAQITYRNYVTVMRKEAAKNAQKKSQFHRALNAFVLQHDIVDLHNVYATIQKRSGSNKTYQLPTFGSTEGSIAS